MSAFPEHLVRFDQFIDEHLTYRNGKRPSKTTLRGLKKELPLVKFGQIEFIDTIKFAELCQQKVDERAERAGKRVRLSD